MFQFSPNGQDLREQFNKKKKKKRNDDSDIGLQRYTFTKTDI